MLGPSNILLMVLDETALAVGVKLTDENIDRGRKITLRSIEQNTHTSLCSIEVKMRFIFFRLSS